MLLLIERRLGQRSDGVMVAGLLVVLKASHRTTLEQMLLDDLGDVFGLDHAVEGAVGVNDHDRTKRAKTEAAGRDELDFLGQTLLCQLSLKSILQRHASLLKPFFSISSFNASIICWLPEEVQPVPPQINTCVRNILYFLLILLICCR